MIIHLTKVEGPRNPPPRPPIKSGGHRRRNVTLIIGLKTRDGVIVAAEAEETTGIAAKHEVDKLARIAGPDWALAVGGAGDTAIIENVVRRMRKELLGRQTLSQDDIANALDEV